AHLAPFLPGHPMLAGPAARPAGPAEADRPAEAHGPAEADGPASPVGPVAAAPYGSAGILPISWAYIRMMGADGLRRATLAAVLAANYVAVQLGPHYPVLYTGRGGLVAHECVIDLRPITKETGVSVDD